MIKRAYQKILITAILLVTVLSMLGMAVAAAVVNEYTVTFVYDDALCKSLIFKVDGVVIPPVSEGSKEYRVDGQHSTVTVEIVPATGYAVESLKSEIQPSEGVPQISDCALTVGTDKNGNEMYSYSAPLDSSVTTFSISFLEREYTIKVKPGPEGSHKWSAGTTDPSNTTYRYTTDEDAYIALSVPTLSGYIFNGWLILSSENAQDGTLLPCKPGEDHVKLYKNTVPKIGATLYLMPDWIKEEYYVYRQDREYGTDLLLSKDEHGVAWKMEIGSTVDGSMGEAVTYLGYYPFAGEYADSKYHSSSITVNYTPSDNLYRNTVTRYYVPITYTLVYKGFEGDDAAFEAFQKLEGYSATHVYNATTQIPQPQREGYDFAGWQVYVGDNNITTLVNPEVTSAIKQLKLDSRQTCFADGNTTNEITLVATWTPKSYSITYDWNGIDPSVLVFNQSAYTQYVFDTALEIPVPLRKGYSLVGWELVSGSVIKTLTPADGKIVLEAETYTDDITLKAVWKQNTYTVTLNGNGITLSTNPFTVTYDTALTLPTDFALPTYTGHTFLGFFTKNGDEWGSIAWIDAEGKALDKTWDIDADTVLYAKWSVNTYQIGVSVQDKTNNVLAANRVSISVTDATTGATYDYLNEKIAYGTVLKIKIELAADFDYKIVSRDGEACAHQKTVEFTYTVGAADYTLIAKALPVIAMPSYTLDYTNEILRFPNGSYQIVCEGVTLETTGELKLRDEFFGKTLQITVLGVSGESADRELTLTLAQRPDAPVLDDRDEIDEGEQIAEIIPTESSIVIGMIASALEKYDFLYFCSVSDITVSKDQWKPLTVGENGRFTIESLSPGTYYYVYICVKAKDGEYPQGYVFKYRLDTEARSFIEDTKQALMDMINPSTDGEYVQTLIDTAIADIDSLTYPSATFSDEVQAILNLVSAQLPIARAKDVNIDALNELYAQLIATNSFNESGETALKTICENAVEQIRLQSTNTEAKVLTVAVEAMNAMKAVRINYLYSGSNMLIFQNGLPQGTQLVLNAYGSYEHLIDRINNAIRLGMIASDGQGIPLDALETLDLMAYYQLKMTDGEQTMIAPEGVYEIRLTIPEELRGNLGLQAAYYNEKTGMLTVLDSRIEGNELVFYSNRSGIGDFLILGDTTVIMTSFIAALGITFLCQLIAIIVLVACRVRSRKAAKADKHYGLMLPLALTIRFLPENAMMLLVVLGTLVAIAQLVLMYLIFTSDFAHRSVIRKRGYRRAKKKTKAAEQMPIAPEVNETVDRDEQRDEAMALSLTDAGELTDEADGEELSYEADESYDEDPVAVAYADDEAFTEGDAQPDTEAFAEFAEDAYEADADVDGDAEYEDYEDFIEPAPNPNYSLPSDDEDLYVDTVTGEIYSADELNENDVILDDLEDSENAVQSEDDDTEAVSDNYQA